MYRAPKSSVVTGARHSELVRGLKATKNVGAHPRKKPPSLLRGWPPESHIKPVAVDGDVHASHEREPFDPLALAYVMVIKGE
jgi:hypothetical protein